MTLLESLVALVILGLTALGFLQAFQVTSRSTRNSADWVHAVSYAESAMEQTKLGTNPGPFADSLATGHTRTIDVQPWPVKAGIAQVTVMVTLPGGGAFVLQRLVRTE